MSLRVRLFDRLSPHRLVDRHFAGITSGFAERRLWRHLPRCSRCRDRYRAHALLEALESPDGQGAGEADGLARSRQRLQRSVFGVGGGPRRRWGGGLTVTLTLAVGAAALLLVRDRPPEFQARGGAGASSSPSLEVFRVGRSGAEAGGGPARVAGTIRAGDGLVFAYRNPPERGRRYLMVFATDGGGRVFWYWPAWTDPASVPVALPIRVSSAPVELPESVRHPLAVGPLRLVGLFCDQAFTVEDVEAALAQDDRALDPLGCDLWREPLEVTP